MTNDAITHRARLLYANSFDATHVHRTRILSGAWDNAPRMDKYRAEAETQLLREQQEAEGD